MVMNPKLTHIALRVKNIEASAAFYKKYVNLEIVAQREETNTRVAWLGNKKVKEHFVIVLLEMPYNASEQPSYDHFGLDVPAKEDIDRMAEIARQDDTLAFGPKYVGPVAGYLCLIRDPDGNCIEFSHDQKIDGYLNNEVIHEDIC